jgi:hypothetical protein
LQEVWDLYYAGKMDNWPEERRNRQLDFTRSTVRLRVMAIANGSILLSSEANSTKEETESIGQTHRERHALSNRSRCICA